MVSGSQLSPAVSNSSIASRTDEQLPKDYEFITRRLSTTEVAARYMNAKPVVIVKEQYFKIKDLPIEKLGEYSFNWYNDGPSSPVIRENTSCQLKILQQKKTFHSSVVFFKPDAVEVLNQLPENLLGKKVYFSTKAYGNGTIYDQDPDAYPKGFFAGETTFYEEIESESSQQN